MSTGVVKSVTPRNQGGTLSVAVLSSDTVLPIDNAGDFEEEFDASRFLVIADESTPREYVAVENDEDVAQQSVTLAAAVGGTGFEAGVPVTLWDPEAGATDKRAVTYRAWVLLSDQEKPIPADLPHTVIPLGGAYTLEGASVRIEENAPGQWHVENVLGREAVIDADSILTPYLTAWMPSDVSIPNNTLQTVLWDNNIRQAQVIEGYVSGGSGDAYIAAPSAGIYVVIASGAFFGNATGFRYVQIVIADPDGSNPRVERMVTMSAGGTGTVVVQAIKSLPLLAGERVIVKVQQTSGAALDLLSRIDLTGIEVTKVAAR